MVCGVGGEQLLDFQLSALNLGLSVMTRIKIMRCTEKFFLDVVLGLMERHEAAERQLMVRVMMGLNRNADGVYPN